MSLSKTKQKIDKLNCVVCNAEITKYNIGMHVKKYHNLDPDNYKIKYGLKKDPTLRLDICKSILCNKEFKKPKPNSKCCSEKCYKNLKKEQRIKNSLSKHTDPSKYTECQICKFRGKNITRHILVTHKMKSDEYKRIYNESLISNDYRECMSERNKGELNPGYNHGGKFSSLSKSFVKYSNISIEDRNNKILDVSSKISISNKENGNNNTTLIYYAKQGYSKQKAKKLLSERQRTFSLSKCIERYGEENGEKIHRKRQEKWQTTLNAKSNEEIENINKQKSSKINFNSLWSLNLNHKGYFYIIELKQDKVKIGITSRDIQRRYPGINESTILILKEATNISHAFMVEQIIKKLFFDNIKKDDYGVYGWTEVLNDIDIEEVKSIAMYLLNSYEISQKYFEEIKNGNFI